MNTNISFSQPACSNQPKKRRIAVFQSRADEAHFLEVALSLLPKGTQLGPDDMTRHANIANNPMIK